MRIRSSISALSSALALALMLSATAFADPPQFEPIGSPPSIVEIGQQIQPKTPPKPQGQDYGYTFKPDVRVSYHGQIVTGASVKYRFHVENIGIGTATNITLGEKVYQEHSFLGTIHVQGGPPATIPSLATGELREVNVTCLPIANHRCEGAALNAVVPHDLNLSNNHADS